MQTRSTNTPAFRPSAKARAHCAVAPLPSVPSWYHEFPFVLPPSPSSARDDRYEVHLCGIDGLAFDTHHGVSMLAQDLVRTAGRKPFIQHLRRFYQVEDPVIKLILHRAIRLTAGQDFFEKLAMHVCNGPASDWRERVVATNVSVFFEPSILSPEFIPVINKSFELRRLYRSDTSRVEPQADESEPVDGGPEGLLPDLATQVVSGNKKGLIADIVHKIKTYVKRVISDCQKTNRQFPFLGQIIIVCIAAVCYKQFLKLPKWAITSVIAALVLWKHGSIISTFTDCIATLHAGFTKEAEKMSGEPTELSKDVERELEKLREWDPDIDHKIFQGPPVEGPIVPQGANTWLAMAASMFLLRKSSLVFKLINHSKFEQGLDAYLEGGKGAAQCLVNLVLSSFTDKRVEWVKQRDQACVELCNESAVFCRDLKIDSEINSELKRRFLSYRNALELKKIEHAKDPQMERIIGRSLEGLANLAVMLPAFLHPGAARPEPPAIMLSGDPGCGKSTVTRTLSMQLASAFFTPEELKSVKLEEHIFQKGSSAFWDGYKDQLICTFDDFGQVIKNAGDNNEAELMIKAGNQWPYPLDMAALPMKGRFYFNSQMIIATTNLEIASQLEKVITSPKALARRFCFWYKLVRKGEASPDASFDEIYEFYEYDFVSGKCLEKPPLKYTEVRDKMLQEYARRQAFNEAKLRSDQELITRDHEHLRGLIRPQGFNGGALTAIGACLATAVLSPPIIGRTFRGIISAAKTEIEAGAVKLRQITMSEVDKVAASIRHMALKGISIAAIATLGLYVGLKLANFVRKLFAGTVAPQGNAPDLVCNKIAGNVHAVYASNGTQQMKLGYGLALDNHQFTFPEHYLTLGQKQFGKDCRYFARNPQGAGFPIAQYIHIDAHRDLVVCKAITSCKSITSHIGHAAKGTRCYLVNWSGNQEVNLLESTQGAEVHYGVDGQKVKRCVIAHSGRTVDGDCGSPIIVIDQQNQARLLGFHTAARLGINSHGFLTSLTAIQSKVDPQAFCGHEEVGTIPIPVHNGRDTQLVKTSYAHCIGEVVTTPAPKRPVNGIDPMLQAIESSNLERPPLPPHTAMVCDAVVGAVMRNFDPSQLVTRSFEEAAAGLPGEKYMNPINRGNSPGFPMIQQGFHNKKKIFGAEGPFDFTLPGCAVARQAHDDLLASYRRGERSAIYRDCLKDEPISLQKAAEGRTRIISASPLAYTLLTRRYFMGFAAEFMRNRHLHGGMVGINPYSAESGQVFSKLARMNKQNVGFAGDYKAFDKTQHPEIMKLIWTSICERMPEYKGEERIVFDMIGLETYNATHLGGNCYRSDTLYRVDGSLPSGHPLTSILNSIYNMVVFRMAWVDKYSIRNLLTFEDHVALVVFGDDNACAPDDEHLAFDMANMKEFCKRVLNMTYTSEDKTSDVYHHKPVIECGFLKRKYSVEESYTYALLDRASIDGMFHYRKKSTPELDHFKAVAAAALMEASAYSIDVFGEYFDFIVKFAKNNKLIIPSTELSLQSAYMYWRAVYRGYEPSWSSE